MSEARQLSCAGCGRSVARGEGCSNCGEIERMDAAHSIELVRAHVNAISELTDRFESSARADDTLDIIEHHTRQIDALLKTARTRRARELIDKDN